MEFSGGTVQSFLKGLIEPAFMTVPYKIADLADGHILFIKEKFHGVTDSNIIQQEAEIVVCIFLR